MTKTTKAVKVSWPTGRRRLLKLADHLESGKLGHKKFHFGLWNEEKGYETIPYKCGYMGCAVGECPVLFPRQWKFDFAGDPVLRTHPDPKTKKEKHKYFVMPIDDAADFFGLSSSLEATRLFVPEEYRPWADSTLTNRATKKQVAKSIREFVEWKDGGGREAA